MWISVPGRVGTGTGTGTRGQGPGACASGGGGSGGGGFGGRGGDRLGDQAEALAAGAAEAHHLPAAVLVLPLLLDRGHADARVALVVPLEPGHHRGGLRTGGEGHGRHLV